MVAGNWIAVSLTWGNRVVARNSLYQLSGEYQLCFDQLYKECMGACSTSYAMGSDTRRFVEA